MSAALSLPEPALVRDDWTAEDLHHLPDDYRHEIVDGVLHMSPSPRRGHQQLSVALLVALQPFLPEGWSATVALDVVLTEDARNVRQPDIVVYRDGDPDQMVRFDEVALVVEVVSPGSRTEDRVTKPVVYAEAGIPAYWRVEQKPALSVVEYQLTELGKYYEHSARAGVSSVDKPWPIEIDLDEVAREAGLA
ncbi:MAG: Uma2 family endonuclease [Micromonosporaceae bacterium]